MVLGKRDKDVLRAFSDHRPADSKKLYTDGVVLDGLWMGGHNIAEWAADHVVFHDLGSKAAQTVQHALKKLIPARQFGGFNHGPGEKWIALALKKHKRGALHRQMHVSTGEKIPIGAERREARKPGVRGKRARLALTLRGFGRHRRRR